MSWIVPPTGVEACADGDDGGALFPAELPPGIDVSPIDKD